MLGFQETTHRICSGSGRGNIRENHRRISVHARSRPLLLGIHGLAGAEFVSQGTVNLSELLAMVEQSISLTIWCAIGAGLGARCEGGGTPALRRWLKLLRWTAVVDSNDHTGGQQHKPHIKKWIDVYVAIIDSGGGAARDSRVHGGVVYVVVASLQLLVCCNGLSEA